MITTIFYLSNISLWKFSNIKKKQKEFYSEYPYTCHLEFILYPIFYCTFFITYLFIHLIFLMPFNVGCRHQYYCFNCLLFKKWWVYLLSLLAFSSEFIDLFFVWRIFSPDHMVLNILQFFSTHLKIWS